MLALTFVGKEVKPLVLLQWSSDRAAELLPAVRGSITASLVREEINLIQSLITEEAISRTVIAVSTTLGNHVDGSTFTAPVSGRKTLRTDGEFLHRFQGELHDGSANSIIFVV